MAALDVTSIKRDVNESAFFVDLIVIDDNDNHIPILNYAYRPDDPYGLSPSIGEWLETHDGEYTIQPYVPSAPQPVVYQISKTTPWLRMTEPEAATMDAVMSETGARLKQIYMAATYLASNDPLWATLHEMLADAFGAERADQLLAPEA